MLSAIIAVNNDSATSLSPTNASPLNFQTSPLTCFLLTIMFSVSPGTTGLRNRAFSIDIKYTNLPLQTEKKTYTDIDKIKKEVEEAKNTFRKYKWPMIDVTRKSVEETAASVIKIYEIYKSND